MRTCKINTSAYDLLITANGEEKVNGDSQMQYYTPGSCTIISETMPTKNEKSNNTLTNNEENTNFPHSIDNQKCWEGHKINLNEINHVNIMQNNAQNVISLSSENNPTVLNIQCTMKIEESGLIQVKKRFRAGCECRDSCFREFIPENVYKHRLNIENLTKAEHDIYLMGIMMACIVNPNITIKQRERRRNRYQYVFQGRKVCLNSFLFLENCTLYQLKCIRKHVMVHGVVPRSHCKIPPHNKYNSDSYTFVTDFLNQYLKIHTGSENTNIRLPRDITKLQLFESYKDYTQNLGTDIRLLSYKNFQNFVDYQFPNTKFYKTEPISQKNIVDEQQQYRLMNQYQTSSEESRTHKINQVRVIVGGEVIPLIVSQGAKHQQAGFLVTPRS